MSIEIFNFDGSSLTTLTDGALDLTATSLKLVGRGYKGWGQPTQQNLIWVMQNFAGTTPPENPITGQMWYDTNSGIETIKVWNGFEWSTGASIAVKPTPPDNSNVGSLWYDTSTKQLYAWNGVTWDLVGPLGAKNNLDPEDPSVPVNSKIEAMSVRAVEDASLHQIWRITIGGALFAIFSKDQMFTPSSTTLTTNGFPKIYPGITFNSNLANIGVSGDATVFKSTQSNLPSTDNTYTLGSAGRRFSQIYSVNNTVSGALSATGTSSFTGPATFTTGNVTFGGNTAYVQSTRWLPGTLLLTPMLGAVEFDGNYFYFTTTVGGSSVRQSPILVNNPLIPEITNISRIGPFIRSGITVGTYVDEVSNDTSLTHLANTALDNTTVPTQYAVKQYFLQVNTNITPASDGVGSIGSAQKRWDTLYSNVVAKTTTTEVLNATTVTSTALTSTNANLTNLNAGTIIATTLQTGSININSISAPTLETTKVIATTGNISVLNTSSGNITSLSANEISVSGNIIVGGNVIIDNVGARQFNATSADTVSRPGFSWKGNTNTGMFRPATNTIAFAVNASEALRIDSTGVSASVIKLSGALPSTQSDTTVATTEWVKTNAGFQGHIVLTSISGGTGTLPAGITKIKVTVLGGGGGGGSSAGSSGRAGGGGGAGGTAVKYITGALGGALYSYAIGAGGAGVAGGAGGVGGNTNFTINSQTVIANGGTGGAYGASANTNYAGGSGGTATNGDYNIAGSAGDNSVGTNNASSCKGGNGGVSSLGGAGRGGVNGSPATAGAANSGSGGGGAASVSGVAVTGAAGGSGIIIIEY